MGKKRFVVKELNYDDVIFEDTVTNKQYNEYGIVEVVNRQQERINELCAALKIEKAISTQRSISNLIYKNE